MNNVWGHFQGDIIHYDTVTISIFILLCDWPKHSGVRPGHSAAFVNVSASLSNFGSFM